VVEIFIAFGQQGFQHPYLEAAFRNYRLLLQDLDLSESEIEAKIQSLLPVPRQPPWPVGVNQVGR
jgi:hypothetical protein